MTAVSLTFDLPTAALITALFLAAESEDIQVLAPGSWLLAPGSGSDSNSCSGPVQPDLRLHINTPSIFQRLKTLSCEEEELVQGGNTSLDNTTTSPKAPTTK